MHYSRWVKSGDPRITSTGSTDEDRRYKEELRKLFPTSTPMEINRLLHPERYKARLMKKRILVNISHCDLCGDTETLSTHHFDYNRPDMTLLLCKNCHAFADSYERRCNGVRKRFDITKSSDIQ